MKYLIGAVMVFIVSYVIVSVVVENVDVRENETMTFANGDIVTSDGRYWVRGK